MNLLVKTATLSGTRMGDRTFDPAKLPKSVTLQMEHEWTDFGLVFVALVNACTQIDVGAWYPDAVSYLACAMPKARDG